MLSVNLFLQDQCPNKKTMHSSTTILQINTAFSEASIGIGKDGLLVDELTNTVQLDHAAFIQPAIRELCDRNGISLGDCSAVAVVNGPGSYTGLRVGLSSAKGICYALKKPLICINTLEWMAFGNRQHGSKLICPMIDARRMEVFRAVYDSAMQLLVESGAEIIDANSFSALLKEKEMVFVGDGAEKWKQVCQHNNAHFPTPSHSAADLASIAFRFFEQAAFADLGSVEPFYTKAFYSKQPK